MGLTFFREIRSLNEAASAPGIEQRDRLEPLIISF